MVPLFKTSYSLLRSILTLDPRQEDRDPEASDSIVDIAVEHSLNRVCIVDDSISSLLPSILAFQKEKIEVVYGYRVTFVNDVTEKTDDSIKTGHKNIVFIKNKAGYSKLIRLATLAGTDNFYKEPRLSYADLHKVWDDEDLALAVPFYDSFLHRNLLHDHVCIPDFKFIKPTFFIEDNLLPFDYLIQDAANKFAKDNKYDIINTKSVYYKNRDDFDAYMAIKCLNRKVYGSGRTLESPDLEHMSSREFCFESFLDKVDRF
jgi:DNA polymerase III alpha subunit